MKKVFTIILAAAGTISFASAQSHKSIAYNDNKQMSDAYDQHASFGKSNSIAYNDAYFSYKEKQAKLDKINREFDQKIAFVKYDRHLRNREKSKQIKLLENQRKNEISKVEFQFAKSNHKAGNKTFGHDSHKW
jgi:hypothetical protein